MKIIKFKAWDKHEEKMIKDFTNYAGWKAITNHMNVWCDDRYIKLPFTGVKDKTGKDIYKGDILLKKKKWGNDILKIKGKVEFRKLDGFIVEYIGYKCEPCSLYEFCSALSIKGETIEVIGNEFEHPELLKE